MVARAASAERSTIEWSRWRARETVGGRKGGTEPLLAGEGRGGAGRRARPDGSSPEKAPAARVPVSAGSSAPCPTLVLQTHLCDLCAVLSRGCPARTPVPSPGCLQLGPLPSPQALLEGRDSSRRTPAQETSSLPYTSRPSSPGVVRCPEPFTDHHCPSRDAPHPSADTSALREQR